MKDITITVTIPADDIHWTRLKKAHDENPEGLDSDEILEILEDSNYRAYDLFKMYVEDEIAQAIAAQLRE